MGAITKTLYETDFAEWADQTAALIRAGRLNEVDLEHVAEEIGDLGKAERKAVRSQLRRLMMHLLKQKIQPERSGRSWHASIIDARIEIETDLEDSPSLWRYLRENLDRIYGDAVQQARAETSIDTALPERCPWTVEELLTADLDDLRNR